MGRMTGRSLRAHLSWPFSLDAVWLLAPALALSAIALLSPVRPHDYFWALVQGRTTWELGSVARHNAFLYTIPETAPFVNQAWLGQLLLYAGYGLGGHTFNLVLLALLLAVSLSLAMDGALLRGARPTDVAVVALVSLPLLALGSGVRTQMFAYPCFVLILRFVLLESPRLAPRPLAVVLVATLLWANTHGSFVLAPAVVLARAAVGIWSAPREARGRAAREHGLELALVLAATCVNPRGPLVYGYALGLPLAMGVLHDTDVNEWRALSPVSPFGLTVIAGMLAGVALGVRRRGRVNLAALGVFLACAALCFVSQRFLAWAALGAVLVLPILTRPEREVPAGDRGGVAGLNAALIGALVLGVVASLPGGPLFQRFAPCAHLPYSDARVLGKETPLRLAEHLAREGAAGRIFHDQAAGGLLEWTLARSGPQAVAFVDQRFEIVPPEIWAQYFTVASAVPGWKAILDHYGIGTLLIDQERQHLLVDAVEREREWRLVARELSYRLYMRTLEKPPGHG
jgi:hypothetical protein